MQFFKKTTLTLKTLFVCTTVFFSLVVYAAEPPTLLSLQKKQDVSLARNVSMSSAVDYIKFMHQNNISIRNINSEGVPTVYCNNLPNDLRDMNTSEKKEAFIMIMLPIIKKVNGEIKETRERVMDLHNRLALSSNESRWLDDVYAKYNVQKGDFNHLLSKVNIVPASLVLAQSIDESGWGTSYTAKHGNALFGQNESPQHENYVIHTNHGRVKLAGFNSLYDSVNSYINNLNINPAYQSFRVRREKMQNDKDELLGYSLANGLVHYSSRGRNYIRDLHKLMSNADLSHFDHIQLAENKPIHITFSYS
ncbi:MAG: glucosaminidase domain-containing protein [Plesiomonas sp.]